MITQVISIYIYIFALLVDFVSMKPLRLKTTTAVDRHELQHNPKQVVFVGATPSLEALPCV